MTRDLLGRISLVLSIFCCLGACNFGSPRMEADLKANVRRLGELLQEYSKIPEKKRELKEGEYGEHRFVVWKDQAQIKSFYEQYRDEMRRIDRTFLAVSENKSAWSDDAAFCRGILHWLLTQLVADKQTQDNALDVWNKFTEGGLAVHIEEPTKSAMGDVFVNQHSMLLTPSLSYEENIQVIFQAYTALLLVKMKDYQKAIKANQLIVQRHPTSKYAEHYASDQIQIIVDIINGKITVPETLPE